MDLASRNNFPGRGRVVNVSSDSRLRRRGCHAARDGDAAELAARGNDLRLTESQSGYRFRGRLRLPICLRRTAAGIAPRALRVQMCLHGGRPELRV